MILLWGVPTELPLARVRSLLTESAREVVVVDQLQQSDQTVELHAAGGQSGVLRLGPRSINLSDVSAIYVRAQDVRQLTGSPDVDPMSPEFRHAAAFQMAFASWLDWSSALVVNRPSAMASNSSKLYQLGMIRSSIFRVPETVATTDAEALRRFVHRHPRPVYKSISCVRSIVSRLDGPKLDDLRNLDTCPTQFQEYVEGVDVRVHVVGSHAFATEVCSKATDYRYAMRQGLTTELRVCTLPRHVETGCIELARAMNLLVAGIDLRRTPNGEWYCFEVNPSPAFTYYEDSTGQGIGHAIASLLTSCTPDS